MKKLILSFILTATLVSCGFFPIPMTEDVTYAFTSDKNPETRTNDTICFKDSSSNLKDTFQINAKAYFKVNDNVTYNQAEYVYTLLNINRKFTDIFVCFNCMSYDEAFQCWRSAKEISTGFEKKNTIASFVLNDKTYSSVDVFSNDNSTNTGIIPNTIYFSCKYGILRYEYQDGRVYELVNK